jgi:hypothetical protein
MGQTYSTNRFTCCTSHRDKQDELLELVHTCLTRQLSTISHKFYVWRLQGEQTWRKGLSTSGSVTKAREGGSKIAARGGTASLTAEWNTLHGICNSNTLIINSLQTVELFIYDLFEYALSINTHTASNGRMRE